MSFRTNQLYFRSKCFIVCQERLRMYYECFILVAKYYIVAYFDKNLKKTYKVSVSKHMCFSTPDSPVTCTFINLQTLCRTQQQASILIPVVNVQIPKVQKFQSFPQPCLHPCTTPPPPPPSHYTIIATRYNKILKL